MSTEARAPSGLQAHPKIVELKELVSAGQRKYPWFDFKLDSSFPVKRFHTNNLPSIPPVATYDPSKLKILFSTELLNYLMTALFQLVPFL